MNELSSSFANLSLSHPLFAHPLPAIGLKENKSEIVDAIFSALRPHVGSPEETKEARATPPESYNPIKSPQLFIQDEATQIAEAAGRIFSNTLPEGSFYLTRRLAGTWKLFLPKDRTSFLLLPAKRTFQDIVSSCKHGRVSLLCSKTESSWKAVILWNQQDLKTKSRFTRLREKEQRLQQAVGEDFFVKTHYDFAVNSPKRTKRSVFYTWNRCLYFWIRPNISSAFLQNIALQVAKKVQALHAKNIVVIDLKSENFLITKDHKLRACDPDRMEFDLVIRKTAHHGTIFYDPPEVLLGESTDAKKSDSFCFGSILLDIMFHMDPPWSKEKRRLDEKVLAAYEALAEDAERQLQNPDTFTPRKVALCLVKWAFHPKADKRPTFDQFCYYLEKDYPLRTDSITNEESKAFFTIEIGA